MTHATFRGRLAAPFFLSAAAVLPLTAAARDWEPYLLADSFAHAEPVSVHAYVNEWDGRLHKGSDALTHTWFEAGVRQGPWSWGYVQRYDWELRASRDTALLYYQVKNEQELVSGTVYELDLRAYHNRSQGLRVAYAFARDGWRIEPALSLLSGQGLIHGGFAGQAMAVDEREYVYEASVRYFYDEDVLFKRPVDAPEGEGLSLDFTLSYEPAADWRLSLVVRDALGFVRWHDAPVTEARATSDVREFDENGYIRFRPTLTGREFNESFTQRLHPRGLLTAQWLANDTTRLGMRVRLTEVRHYLSLVAERDLATGISADLEVMPDLQALGLGVKARGFRLGVMSDRLKFEDARLLQLQLGWSWLL